LNTPLIQSAAVDETIHLRAAGDGAPRSLIRLSAFFL